ncbi:MAG: transposase [Bryobacteraceae bacterium]
MRDSPFTLTMPETFVVLEAIREVSDYRQWELLAAHVRATHAHVVVHCETSPHQAISDFKAYATRRLNARGTTCRRWARGGNVARLATETGLREAFQYVIGKQGQAMALYVSERNEC